MATTAGIKNLSFNTVDGGDLNPSASITAGTSVVGTLIDLLTDTVNGILPDEVALRVGIEMTHTGVSFTGASTPLYEVYALWQTATAAGSPTTKDDEVDLVAFLSDTTTVASLGAGVPAYTFKPTNPRIFATKGRYLKLKYKINNAANISDIINFGADWAGIFGKTG